MRAVSAYAGYVRTACERGIDAIVMGAGLPLDLPDLAADHPEVALIPILSDARGIQLVVRKWARKDRLPDAIVIEHPRYAGGHLGASSVDDLADPRFDFERVIPETLEFFHRQGIAPAIAGQPLVGAAHFHQPLVGLQQSRAGEGASGKADQQFHFGRGQAAHLRGGFVDDSHEAAPSYERQASSKRAAHSTVLSCRRTSSRRERGFRRG